eukprot:CFRG2193T1
MLFAALRFAVANLVPTSGGTTGLCQDNYSLTRTYVHRLGWLIEITPETELLTARNAVINLSYFSEYCLSTSFDPYLITRLMYFGFITMGLYDHMQRTHSLIPKMHKHRCILHFPSLKMDKSIRKRSKRFQISFNRRFDRVLDECVNANGNAWLTLPLVQVFKYLHHNTVKTRPAKLCSFEVLNEGMLVGGEIGYTVGTVYTSLTGFHTMNSAGTIQMIATAKLLQSLGFAFWDLGMDLPYKRRLGAITHPVNDFLSIYDGLRDLPTPVLPSSIMNAYAIIASTNMHIRPVTKSTTLSLERVSRPSWALVDKGVLDVDATE